MATVAWGLANWILGLLVLSVRRKKMTKGGWIILAVVTISLVALNVLVSYFIGVKFYINLIMVVGYALFISRLIRYYS